MDIGDWGTAGALYQQIRELDLERNVAELDAFGFTVLEPERVAPPGWIDGLRDRMLAIAEERTGVLHDVVTGAHGTLEQEPRSRNQYLLYYLLFEDPVFQEALLSPSSLALQTYMLGFDCRLLNVFGIVKWQDERGYGPGLGLHADSVVPPQLMGGKETHTGNSTLLLTDYTRDDGALAVVPGSHREGRSPDPRLQEGVDRAVAIEAPAGSLVVWNGNLWHGAYPRANPGLRLSLAMYFGRSYLQVLEDYRPTVTDEILTRNPKRLAVLLGLGNPWGVSSAAGPDYSAAARVMAEASAEIGVVAPPPSRNATGTTLTRA